MVIYKCNLLLFKQHSLIFLLSTTSMFKLSRWSLTFFTVRFSHNLIFRLYLIVKFCMLDTIFQESFSMIRFYSKYLSMFFSPNFWFQYEKQYFPDFFKQGFQLVVRIVGCCSMEGSNFNIPIFEYAFLLNSCYY